MRRHGRCRPLAADIPLDDAGFTGYVQAKLQLYTRAKVGSDAPLMLAVGPVADMELDFNLHAVHDRCVAVPTTCGDTVHDYVQEVVVAIARAEQRGPAPPKPALEPSDRDAFARDVAQRASALAPGASIVADGGTVLVITRQGGHPFRFDVKSLYQDCQHAAFACALQVQDLAARMAAYLDMPERSGLRAAPGFVRGLHRHRLGRQQHHLPHAPVAGADGRFLPARLLQSRRLLLQGNAARRAGGDQRRPRRSRPQHRRGGGPVHGRHACDAAAAGLQARRRARVGRIEAPWAASYALFGDDWASFAAAAGGHVLIAVPARDVLLYVKGDGEEQQRVLAAAAMDMALHSPSPISTDVYRWTGSSFTLGTDTSTMTQWPARRRRRAAARALNMTTLYNRIAGRNRERLAALSDGVFAFAMTVLVLDIRPPALDGIHSEADLFHALVVLSPPPSDLRHELYDAGHLLAGPADPARRAGACRPLLYLAAYRFS